MLFFSTHYFSVTQQSKHLDIGISYSVILVSAKGKYAVNSYVSAEQISSDLQKSNLSIAICIIYWFSKVNKLLDWMIGHQTLFWDFASLHAGEKWNKFLTEDAFPFHIAIAVEII